MRWILLLIMFRRLLLRGLLFVHSGDYVNMSCVDPGVLSPESSSSTSRFIKIAGTRRCAVGIMLGIVTECNIVSAAIAGPPSATYSMRRITIAPFDQEFRRDTSVWGQVLEFHSIVGTISAGGVSFSSRRKIEIPQGGDSTPKKSAAYLTQVTSPLAASSAGRAGTSYPTSRGFDDPSMSPSQSLPSLLTPLPVPIYDGRRHTASKFSFDDQGFKTLSDLPLYRGGKRDLSNKAVVAVGYTVGTWTGRSGESDLSTNLQFVILLGNAAAKPVAS